ncbi:unnamed protein product [Schistosoma margrebowiei]|uniref:Uncharacterized protein n=1 Tax=Schistosoma margrebowiei TaxID=48269 RepID=A0A183LMD5_9TREM|nr:unnamed protein product [Schistosoma margrebowiei]
MEDVRTKRGADIAPDHHLLVAKMKLKLKKYWTTWWTISQKFNTAFLRDTDKLNKSEIALSNKFQAFHDLLSREETTMESNWNEIKEATASNIRRFWATRNTITRNGSLLIHWMRFKKGETSR